MQEGNMESDHGPSNVAAANCKALSQVPTDIALVHLIAQGDKNAMQVLFARHRVRVYRFLFRLTHNRAMAEDLVSEVFLQVWRTAGRYEARSQVTTWLLGIGRNRAWSTLRRYQAEGLAPDFVDELPDTSDSPEAAMYQKQQREILAHCLARLSRSHREVIDLVYYHERTVSEVAEIVGIPLNTVKTRMHYARKEIAELLKAFGIDRRGSARRSRGSSGSEVVGKFIHSRDRVRAVH
jgi:RNA polymerase sigma-70 factor (ECF subfamily)